jgi:hypothetical protein
MMEPGDWLLAKRHSCFDSMTPSGHYLFSVLNNVYFDRILRLFMKLLPFVSKCTVYVQRCHDCCDGPLANVLQQLQLR